MEKQLIEGDRLYLIAESLAKDFSLFPDVSLEQEPVPGLLTQAQIDRQTETLANLDIDAYIEAVVTPAEDQSRTPAPEIIRQLGKIEHQTRRARNCGSRARITRSKRSIGFMV